MASALGALLNPIDRTPRLHLGAPIMHGRYPGVGHLLAARYALPQLLNEAKRTVGDLFFVEFPGPSGKTLDLVPLEESSFAMLRSASVDSSVLRDGARALLGDSMIALDGAEHHRVRSSLSPSFTPRGLTEASLGRALGDIIVPKVEGWLRRQQIRVVDETQDLALQLVFRMLGVPERDVVAWRSMYRQLHLVVARLPIDFPGSPERRGLRAKAWLDERLVRIVREARSSRDQTSLITRIADVRDAGGSRLSDDEIVENLRLLLLAGHETSATAMAWLLIELGRAPSLFRRLVDEAVAVGEVPTSPRALRNFPFAEALFREVVRLRPPIPLVSRMIVAGVDLGPLEIPAGTRVTFPLVHYARDASRYPDPLTFFPDRWLGRSAPPTSIETLPFGGGSHFCLGYHVAWMEVVQLAVAFALAANAARVRPSHEGPLPRSVWFPIAAPEARTIVRFVPA